jgi:hypothetical protein
MHSTRPKTTNKEINLPLELPNIQLLVTCCLEGRWKLTRHWFSPLTMCEGTTYVKRFYITTRTRKAQRGYIPFSKFIMYVHLCTEFTDWTGDSINNWSWIKTKRFCGNIHRKIVGFFNFQKFPMFSSILTTEYERPMKPFFIEIQNFWAWRDKLGR